MWRAQLRLLATVISTDRLSPERVWTHLALGLEEVLDRGRDHLVRAGRRADLARRKSYRVGPKLASWPNFLIEIPIGGQHCNFYALAGGALAPSARLA